MQIWKVPVEGGQATQVTREGGFEGFESTDGKLLYYAKGRLVPGIWQMPVTGGPETPLLDHNNAGYWRLWAVASKGIYFATANEPARPVIEFFNFATRKVTTIATLDKPLSPTDPGLAVAPNGKSIVYSLCAARPGASMAVAPGSTTGDVRLSRDKVLTEGCDE